MSLVFYEAPMSSATPVAWALGELDVPHETVRVDITTGQQRKPEFLKLNPNGKVPTLVVDGTPMFEALAIMTWLGERFGAERGLWPPPDSPARLTALSWSTWAYVSLGSAISRLAFSTSPRIDARFHSDGQAKLARDDIADLLAVLDGRLAERPHLLGDDFSLVDVIVGSVVWYGTLVGAAVDEQPNASRWLERCLERPACQRARIS